MNETTIQEYPKMLYEGGVVREEATGRPVAHQMTRTVNDAEEEAQAREEGFTDAGDDTLGGDAGADTVSGGEPADNFNGADPDAFDGAGAPGGAPEGGARKK